MPRAYPCPACGQLVTTFMQPGESAGCEACGAQGTVPPSAGELEAGSVPPRQPAPGAAHVAQPDDALPRGANTPRLNTFDKLCVMPAFALGLLFLVLGFVGAFWGASANFTLPPGLGVLPAFIGWGIIRSVIVAWKRSRRLDGADLDAVFD